MHRRSRRTPIVSSISFSLAIFLAIFAPVLMRPTPANAQDRPIIAFVYVAVIPMDRERILADQTVLVRGDTILAVGPTAQMRVPNGAVRIDGRGKYLIPGLADMHVHLGNMRDVDPPLPRTAMDSTTDQLLFRLVASGVTTARDMGSDSAHLALKTRIARGEVIGPRLYTAVYAKRCRSSNRPDDQDIDTCVTALKGAGFDYLKLAGLEELLAWNDPEEFDAIVAAATRAGLPVVGHVMPPPRGLPWAFRVPYASIEHLYGYTGYYSGLAIPDSVSGAELEQLRAGFNIKYDPPAIDPVKLREEAATTRRLGIWNTPTLTALEDDDGGTGKLVRRAQQVVRALRDAGAGLLLGTDVARSSHPRGAVDRELAALVAAGLTPYQALASGTRNPATFLGTTSRAGTIEAGKQADLVLLNGNPLQDIRHVSHPEGVLLHGRWLTRAELETGLAKSCWPCGSYSP